jgi:hypothetical protein
MVYQSYKRRETPRARDVELGLFVRENTAKWVVTRLGQVEILVTKDLFGEQKSTSGGTEWLKLQPKPKF